MLLKESVIIAGLLVAADFRVFQQAYISRVVAVPQCSDMYEQEPQIVHDVQHTKMLKHAMFLIASILWDL